MSCEASRKDTLFGVCLLLGDFGFLELVALRAGSVTGDDPVRRLFLNLDPIVPFSPLPRSSYLEVKSSSDKGIVLARVRRSQALVTV